jgi:hypothetical protein
VAHVVLVAACLCFAFVDVPGDCSEVIAVKRSVLEGKRSRSREVSKSLVRNMAELEVA